MTKVHMQQVFVTDNRLHSRWGVWSWIVTCACWPVNPGENMDKNRYVSGTGNTALML